MIVRVASLRVATVLGLLALLISQPAAQTVTESFDYSGGLPLAGLDGGTGWHVWWDGHQSFVTTAEGLTFLGLATSGGAVTPGGPGSNDNYRYFFGSKIGGAGETTHFWYLMRLTGGDSPQWASLAFGSSAGNAWVRIDDQSGERRLSMGAGQEERLLPIGPAVTQTYLVTGFLAIDAAGALTYSCSLWDNPSGPLLSTSVFSDSYWIEGVQYPADWSNGFFGASIGGSGAIMLDEIHLGPDPCPIPEFGTMSVLAGMLGLGGFGLVRRRQYRSAT